jgi:hypothetical protein
MNHRTGALLGPKVNASSEAPFVGDRITMDARRPVCTHALMFHDAKRTAIA